MNIFYVHTDPRIAARMLCDEHVRKMLLESVQMLEHINGRKPFRSPHAKHPCTLWASEACWNYRWLYEHASELSQEYMRRFARIHAWHERIKLSGTVPLHRIRQLLPNETLPVLATFPEFRKYEHLDTCPADRVIRYRAYYCADKVARFATWAHSDKPDWIASASADFAQRLSLLESQLSHAKARNNLCTDVA